MRGLDCGIVARHDFLVNFVELLHLRIIFPPHFLQHTLVRLGELIHFLLIVSLEFFLQSLHCVDVNLFDFHILDVGHYLSIL